MNELCTIKTIKLHYYFPHSGDHYLTYIDTGRLLNVLQVLSSYKRIGACNLSHKLDRNIVKWLLNA